MPDGSRTTIVRPAANPREHGVFPKPFGIVRQSACAEQGGAIRRGGGGAKGWDQGECEPAAHGPDAEPGNRVTGAGAHTSNRKGKEEGTVHCAFPPYQRRAAPGCVLRHQAGGSPRRRRGEMAGLCGKPGDKSPGFVRAGPTGSVWGIAISATVYAEAGRPAAPACGRRPGRQDCPTGDGLLNAIYEEDFLGFFPYRDRRSHPLGTTAIGEYAADSSNDGNAVSDLFGPHLNMTRSGSSPFPDD
jgi:hypothetical protein